MQASVCSLFGFDRRYLSAVTIAKAAAVYAEPLASLPPFTAMDFSPRIFAEPVFIAPPAALATFAIPPPTTPVAAPAERAPAMPKPASTAVFTVIPVFPPPLYPVLSLADSLPFNFAVV